MADLSNSSFIPKRGPTKNRSGSKTKRVYIFTVISYILLFASLLASGAVFFYTGYLERQLEREVATFNEQTSNFSVADYERVQEFDRRLTQATSRLENSISLTSLFAALEAATIDTIKIASLELLREGDEKLVLDASIETDSFDSTIFQRSVYKLSETIVTTEISDVQATGLGDSEASGGEAEGDVEPKVTFTAVLEAPLSAVPYQPYQQVPDFSAEVTVPETTGGSATESTVDAPSEDTSSSVDNEQDI